MFKKLICTIVLLVLSSCGGGGSTTANYSAPSIVGIAQKGPLIYGSYVNAYLLDENLNPTGQSYVTQTSDDLGNFKFSSNISSSLIRLIANGYYFNEVPCEGCLFPTLSSSTTTLSAIVDLTVTPAPTINVLTTLQTPRAITLKEGGKSYTESLQQSAKEVLSVFGIDSSKINDYKSLFGMQINGTKDADAVLLAISATLEKMAAIAQLKNGCCDRSSEMNHLISQISEEVAKYGKLNDQAIISAINDAQKSLDLSSVRSNVENYYKSKGVTLIAPNFEEWIDKDSSKKLPKRLIKATIGVFNDSTNLIPGAEVTSNEITVSDVNGAYVYTQLKSGSGALTPTLLINGKAVSGMYSTVSTGDKVSIKTNAPSMSSSSEYTLVLGSQSLIYKVSSIPVSEAVPQITYDQFVSQGLNTSLYGTGIAVTPNVASDLYYVIVPSGANTPSFANMVEGKDANGSSLSLSGSAKALPANKVSSVTLAAFGTLEWALSYDVYLLVVNTANSSKYLLEKINLPGRALPAASASSSAGGSSVCVSNC